MPDIQQSRIRAVDEKLQAHKISESEYKVYNVSKGTSYDVVKSKGGVWTCNCPWNTKGSRIREGNCKHLVRVLDKENGCGACGRKDQYADLKREYKDEPLLCRMCRYTIKQQLDK